MKKLLPATALMAAACVYVPQTTAVFDPKCRVMTRHMVLQAAQVPGFVGCRNEGCVALLLAAGAITAASAVVSGSIVVAGNVVTWFERRGPCNRDVAPATPSPPAP